MSLAQFVSNQSKAVVVLVILLCVAGLYATYQLPTEIFPQTDFPRVVVVVDNGEVPADQMLVSVTRPVEEAMNGIAGIARIKSATSRGSTEINLFFDWNTDAKSALSLVQTRLAQVALPQTAQVRHVERLTFAVFPAISYSLTSGKHTSAEIADIATYTIKPRLARLAGVSNVQISGGKTREFHIKVSAEKLDAHNVSLQQVADAVKNSNILASPGLLEENHALELALVSGQATTLEELNSIVVAVVNNFPVTIADVAMVGEGAEPNYTIVNSNGQRAVLIDVLRQPEANTVSVTDEVKNEFVAIQKQLPADVKVSLYYDQSLLVRDSITSVRDAILLGLILSVAILYGFLRNWGTTFVAVLVIPVTVLTTFLAMWLVGLSFNLMTLGGVAAAIGLVIDDAIVVVENIFAHLVRGEKKLTALKNAISEITIPIIGSTITPVVVFLPLALLNGVTGVFFRSLALTMTVALLTSLVLALTFTPVLAERFIRIKRQKTSELHDENGRVLSAIVTVYERILQFSLHNKFLIFACSIVILGSSFFLYEMLGSEFLPAFDESAFVLDYKTPPGTSLEETDKILRRVEEILQDTPEIESYGRRTGLQIGLSITEPNTGDFMVKLKLNHQRKTEEVIDEIRKKIELSEPALEVEFVGILLDLIGDLTSSPAPVEIRLFGEEKKSLHEMASQVEESIKKVPGVVDTNNGVVESGAALTFKINPEQAARFGITPKEIADSVLIALSGDASTAILQNGRLIAVRVILENAQQQTLETLKALPIHSTTGALLRLNQVAQVSYDNGQTEIERDGLRQSVAVTARLSGSDLGTAIEAIKKQLAKDVKMPRGITVEYGGLYREQQESFKELLISLGLAIALVFLVLLVEFRSFAHPIAIVTGAVLALSGALLALLITRITLNVVSLMGMIMVVGIVAKNGILMLDAVEGFVADGLNLNQALLLSGRRRFRPVLMTSLAAILGMLPLALAFGAGAELLQPLAVAVIGGLAVALLFSLVITPAVYSALKPNSVKN
jgi:CzcA family heavy metal efflux pump